jgi:hypothetical protein
MRRRDFVKTIAGLAGTWPLVVGAQQSEKIPRIGYLSPAGVQPRDEAFRQRLQELGYVEGKTIIVERRFAEGKFERLPTLAEELVRLEVDVIVTAVTQASLAAKYATRTILSCSLRCPIRWGAAWSQVWRGPGPTLREPLL